MTQPVRGKPTRDYPVGIPIRPPPGWQPRAARAPGHASTFPFALIVRAGLIGMIVVVCMGIGWLLVQPRRTRQSAERVAKASPVPAKTETLEPSRPSAAKKTDAPSATRPSPASLSAAKAERPVSTPPVKQLERPRLTYEKHILPIMERACVSCHGALRKRGGLDLRTFTALVRGGDNGPGVKAGNPDDSPLLESIVSGRMPPGKPNALSPGEKKTIRDWIVGGAHSD